MLFRRHATPLDRLPPSWQVTVLTPAADARKVPFGMTGPYRVIPCRYAPARFRQLANTPGGLAAAVSRRSPALAFAPAMAAALWAAAVRYGKEADLIHANWSLAGALAADAARRLGIPAVVTFRGSDLHGARFALLQRRLTVAAVRGARAVVTVADHLCQVVRRLAGPVGKPVVTIENGVDESFYRLPLPQPAGDGRPARFVVVGNLVAGKAVDQVLKAFAAGRRVRPMALDIVGDGPLRPALETMARQLGVADDVTFAGAVEHRQVAGYLARATALVTASLAEGMSNVVREAMAAGRPVIGTQVPGVAEMVRCSQTGWLVAPDRPDQLARYMLQLAEKPAEAAAMGKRARQRALRRGWSWRATARAYRRLFAWAAGKRSEMGE